MQRKVLWQLLIISLLLAANSIFALDQNITRICENILGDKNKILALSYVEFNQSSLDSRGWRQLANNHCYRQAAELIDDYLIAHPGLSAWQKASLLYYGGQMWAVTGNAKKAIMNLEQSKFNKQTKLANQWNTYVNATVAFLQNDKAKLQIYKSQIAKQHPINDEIIHLNSIDIMLNNFGKPYAYIYQLLNEKT